jgi:uncharacterized membrane protein (DUF373 family)
VSNETGRSLLRFSYGFERIIIGALLILMMIVVAIGTFDLGVSLFASLELGAAPSNVVTFDSLREAFGAFLLVIIGLELLETTKMYLRENVVHVEVVFTVAMIGTARHIIDLDPAHAPAWAGASVGVLILSLALAYALVTRRLRFIAPRGQLSSGSETPPAATATDAERARSSS